MYKDDQCAVAKLCIPVHGGDSWGDFKQAMEKAMWRDEYAKAFDGVSDPQFAAPSYGAQSAYPQQFQQQGQYPPAQTGYAPLQPQQGQYAPLSPQQGAPQYAPLGQQGAPQYAPLGQQGAPAYQPLPGSGYAPMGGAQFGGQPSAEQQMAMMQAMMGGAANAAMMGNAAMFGQQQPQYAPLGQQQGAPQYAPLGQQAAPQYAPLGQQGAPQYAPLGQPQFQVQVSTSSSSSGRGKWDNEGYLRLHPDVRAGQSEQS